ncbi:MAG: Smr/MutS family protein [Alphaproteobacteria bacterium]|nr:Smr/MutS family protein [Alphaproteobacteria bacterium]MCY4320578.1 Smr/MutS family protein [Alphaproteobacteria bacterium]
MVASAEDIEIWRRMTRTVRPLPGRSVPPEPGPLAKRAAEPPPVPDAAASMPRAAPVGGGLDKRTARRIRRGALPIDARIDLHGMTREQAYRCLTRFLAESQGAGRRLVLVVTGKGQGADGVSSGVIRREAPHWLARSPNAARVLDTAPAQSRHGGEGALYVYLRKRRP